jgi:hypothetical protein
LNELICNIRFLHEKAPPYQKVQWGPSAVWGWPWLASRPRPKSRLWLASRPRPQSRSFLLFWKLNE